MTHPWAVYGHDWAVETLRKGIANARVRHAYLFTGSESIGRSTLAHQFAMALNCTHDNLAHRPCGSCRSCKLIVSGNHPDILYSQNDPVTGTLKIEEVRSVMQRIALKPYEARFRIAILHDFHRARDTAQDALLKTLEEPPPHALLFLIVPSTEAVLPTIDSRCLTLNLRPLPAEQVRRILVEHWGAAPDTAALLARLSAGRMGWAIHALQNSDILNQRAEALDLLEHSLSLNRAGRFDIAEALSKDKAALAPLLAFWQMYWRDVLLLAHNSPAALCNIDRQTKLEQLVYDITPHHAYHALRATQTVLNYLPLSINIRLALEVMFLDYPVV